MSNDPNWRLPEVPSFTLTSPDVEPGGRLPDWARGSSAGGEDRSPELHWSGAPEGTRSYVLTVYDPDAPTGSGYWHWAVRDIPATVDSLPRDAGNPDAHLLPEPAVTHPMESGLKRFKGASPPAGHGEHRYFFTLSALDVPSLDVDPDATPAVVGFTMRTRILARAQFYGTSETPAP